MVNDAARAAFDLPRGDRLRFVNEDWNDSISNGDTYTLRWRPFTYDNSTQLSLFKISFPSQGTENYELVANISDAVRGSTCAWQPENLGNDLYALGLGKGKVFDGNWTMSPPWKPRNVANRSSSRITHVVVPLVVVLVIYGISLSICLLYRRRKKARCQREEQRRRPPSVPLLSPAADDEEDHDRHRHPSVDTVVTIEPVEDPDGTVWPGVWIVRQSPVNSPRGRGVSWPLTEQTRPLIEQQWPLTEQQWPLSDQPWPLTEMGPVHVRT